MTLTIFDIIAIAIACKLWSTIVDLSAWLLVQYLNPKCISNNYKNPPQDIDKPTDLPPPPPLDKMGIRRV